MKKEKLVEDEHPLFENKKKERHNELEELFKAAEESISHRIINNQMKGKWDNYTLKKKKLIARKTINDLAKFWEIHKPTKKELLYVISKMKL